MFFSLTPLLHRLTKASTDTISPELQKLVNDIQVYFNHVVADPLSLESTVTDTNNNFLDMQNPQNDLGVRFVLSLSPSHSLSFTRQTYTHK
jgi:hypothetical protein